MNKSKTDTREVVILKPRRRWLRRLGLGLLLLVIALVVGHAWWGHQAEKRLDARIRHYQAAGEPMTPEALDAPSIPDERNAAMDLRAAATAIDVTSDAFKAFDALPEPALPLTPEELAVYTRVLDASPEALARATRAAEKGEVDWQVKYRSPMIAVVLNDALNPPRNVARVLAAAALSAHQRGDDAEAVRRLREILAVSRAVDQNPTLVSHLVAIGIGAIASDRAALIAPALRVGGDGDASPEQLRAVLGDLLDAAAMLEGEKRAWRGERVMVVDVARAVARGELDLTANFNPPGHSPAVRRLGGYLAKPLVLGDAALMADYFAGIIATSDGPDLPSQRHRLGEPEAIQQEVDSNRHLHAFASVLMPSFRRAREQTYRGIANRRLAAVALAARWYAIDHDGKLPPTLADLVPKYLPTLPLDPLTAGKPLAYRPDGDRPVVYSVGENGRDDGGRGVPANASCREQRENGDMIVHLKRQPRAVPEASEEEQ